MREDKHLCTLYLSVCVTSLVVFITTITVWYYWDKTLNTCQYNEYDLSRNCGCILYGTWGESFSKGGDVQICYFVVLTPIPIIIWSGLLTLYHGYRGHCTAKQVKVTLITKQSVEAINTQLWWKPLIIFFTLMSVLCTILMFSQGVVLTDGYLKTCDQYRKSVVKELSAGGALAKAIHDRIPCEALYDFLDYLQPDPNTLEDRYRRGSWRIQTDAALKLSIWGSWFTVVLLAIISILNVKCSKMRRKRPILNTSL